MADRRLGNEFYFNRRRPTMSSFQHAGGTTRLAGSETNPIGKFKRASTQKVEPFRVNQSDEGVVAELGIPGINKVFDQNYSSCAKAAWACIIFGVTTVCIYQLGCRVINYLEEPISIDMVTESKTSFDFPGVTLCPFGGLTYNSEIINLKKNYTKVFNTTRTPPWYNLLYLPNVSVALLWELSGLHYPQNIIELYHLCHDDTKKNCHLKTVFKEQATYLGTCLTVTLDGKVTYDGSYNGYAMGIAHYSNVGSYKTIMMRIHEPEFNPRHELYEDSGHIVYPKYVTDVDMTMKEYKRANTKSRPCMPKLETWNCTTRCIEEIIQANVTCKLPYLPAPHLKMCTTPEEAKHTYIVTREVYKKSENRCKHCHRPCHAIHYNIAKNVLRFNGKSTKLTFFVISNAVDVVKEETLYNIVMLIGDIGGTLGFFMGMCVLNAILLLEATISKLLYIKPK